jgi:hypothetical protein
MVKAQAFENGNHRTATLLCLDYLAAHGLEYLDDPTQLYIYLHPAYYTFTDLEEFAKEVSQLLQGATSKEKREITKEMRTHYAFRVKFSDLMWHRTGDARRVIGRIHEQIDDAQADLYSTVASASAAKDADQEEVTAAINSARVLRKDLRDAWAYDAEMKSKWWPQPRGIWQKSDFYQINEDGVNL